MAAPGRFSIRYFDALPGGSVVKLEGDDFGYGRALLATSPTVGPGMDLAAFEIEHNDGPWGHSAVLIPFRG